MTLHLAAALDELLAKLNTTAEVIFAELEDANAADETMSPIELLDGALEPLPLEDGPLGGVVKVAHVAARCEGGDDLERAQLP